ncbi:MAG: response regulator [Phycisphaerales bacterium]
MPKDGGVLRILHADDDESFRLLIRNTIDRDPALAARCEVRLVADGTDAVEYMLGKGKYADREAYPLPHLVLLDQRMVRMDGLEALRAIKADESVEHIPVFLLTTSDQASLAEEFRALRGSLTITKPLDFAKFKPLYSLIVDFAIRALELPRRMPQ